MGREPRFRRIPANEIDWQETPDGTRYVVFTTSPGDPGSTLVSISHMPPGGSEPIHSHACGLVELILEGDAKIGKFAFEAGDVRVLKADTPYGPTIVGPSGCVRLTVFERADGATMQIVDRQASAN